MGDLPYRACAGVVLMSRAGKVFVGERIDTPGAWQMPQGGIDDGEAPRDAALRELEEEIGVAADLVSVIARTDGWVYYDLPDHLKGKLWKGRYRGQKQRWFLLRFEGMDSDISIETKHPEFARWKWVDPGAVVENIVPFKREVYREVMGEFSKYF